MHVPSFVPPVLLVMIGVGFFKALINIDHSNKAVLMVVAFAIQAVFLVLHMKRREKSMDEAYTFIWLFMVTAMLGNLGSMIIDLLAGNRPQIGDIVGFILLAGLLLADRGRKNGKRAKKLLSDEAEKTLAKLKRTAAAPAEN